MISYVFQKTLKMHFMVSRKITILFISYVAINCVTFYYIKRTDEVPAPIIMYLDAVKNDIACHYVNGGDVLPSAEDVSFSPRPDSIFFHETSCRGGLNSRQACAVESAARAHPSRTVYVMFSAPINSTVYHRSCIAKLNHLPNVQLTRVHIAEYAKNTPMQSMLAGDPFKTSEFQVAHSADVLRFLTLYKWGGIYLDTDMLVMKPLTPLGPNWTAREDDEIASVGAIAISMDHVGRKLADAIISESKSTYRPDIWGHNGPGVMTRVLSKMCNTQEVIDWSVKTCQGIHVYPPEYVYPIGYDIQDLYFKPGDIQDGENTYAHHLWNQLTSMKKVEKNSPYAKLAQKFCPAIYEMYGDQFGD